MPWFKVDDGFHGHPKVVELSLGAVGLWTLAGSWCAKYLTDGFVPDKTVVRLGASPDEASELMTADLWLSATGGYEFKDWADYQPLKVDVEAERDAARERMKKVRAAKKGTRKSVDGSEEVQPNVEGTSEEVRIAPSHPSPIPTSPSTKESGARKRATRIPEPFIVNGDMRSWAARETPAVDVDASTRKFVDHWRSASGRNASKLDWVATWRNWLRTDSERAPSTQRKSKDEQIIDVLEMGRRMQAEDDRRAIGQ